MENGAHLYTPVHGTCLPLAIVMDAGLQQTMERLVPRLATSLVMRLWVETESMRAWALLVWTLVIAWSDIGGFEVSRSLGVASLPLSTAARSNKNMRWHNGL